METLINISKIIFFLSISILSVFLIMYFGKISVSMSNLEKSVNELKNKIEPLVDKLTIVSDKSEKILDDLSNKSLLLQDAFVSVRQISVDLLEFEKTIKSSIEKPISMILNTIIGLIAGLKVFNRNKND